MYKTLIHEEKEPVSVAISRLKPSPLNTFDVNDLDDLITSITTFGVLTPLTICGPDDAGVYEILAGERRYKSVLKINEKMPGFLSEVPCYIVGSNDMPQIIKQLIIEESNLEAREDYNRDTHRFQLLKLYKQLADDGTIEEKEIINRLRESLKLSKRYSGMYMTIFRDGIPELMESVESEKKVFCDWNDIDTEKGKNCQNVTDYIIKILGGFADMDDLPTACELFFQYYFKRLSY